MLHAGEMAAEPAVEADVGLVFGDGAGLEGHAGVWGVGAGGSSRIGISIRIDLEVLLPKTTSERDRLRLTRLARQPQT